MLDSHHLLKLVVDSVTDNITVIDRDGKIVFVNKSWMDFSKDNGLTISNWNDINYLRACDDSTVMGEEYGEKAADGIRKVIDNKLNLFYIEYPCHSPDEKRWFMMRVVPLHTQDSRYYVISHINITERKLAEEKALRLSLIDGLTNIPNRRYFDEFVNNEWRRCTRLNLPMSLALVDIDRFKLFNDTYGHQAGDECLIKTGEILASLLNRPGDICARYGGEEFVLVFGGTTLEQSSMLCNKILDGIRELEIPNEKSPTIQIVTVSIGVAMMYPHTQASEHDLIEAADRLLYSAKKKGGNQVVFK